MGNLTSIDDAVRLFHNKISSEVMKDSEGNFLGVSTKGLSCKEIECNQNEAFDYLLSYPKEKLINYILGIYIPNISYITGETKTKKS